MKHMALLFLLIAGSFFGWRYVMKKKDKRLTGMWGRRLVVTFSIAAVVVVALFAVFSSTSWRFF